MYRITDWRSAIGSGGTTAVKRLIQENADVLRDSKAISEWVEHMLGDGDTKVPFHWEEWEEGITKKVSNPNDSAD